MSLPGYPIPGWGREADPGPIPLHPMTAGVVIGTAFGVVRRHAAVLAPVAVLIALLSTGAELGILAAAGSLDEFAAGTWMDDLLKGTTPRLPGSFWAALILSEVISIIGGLLLAGLATAFAGADAMGNNGPGAGRRRLSGRIGPLLALSVVVGVATAAGMALLVIPGVVIYLSWMLATPAAVMERADLPTALRRSSILASGHRMRFLGVLVLSLLIGGLIVAVAQAAVGAVAVSTSPVTVLVLSEIVAAFVAGLTASWTGAVIAVLYIDVRVRTEDLGSALRAYAAARRPNPAGGPALA